MQFALEQFTATKLNSLNTRSEQHGDNLVPAFDFGFTFDVGNTILDRFDPELLPSLFRSAASDAGLQDIPGVEKSLPDFKFPKLALPMKWKGKYSGYTLIVDWGLGEEADSNIKLEQCKVSKFQFTPRGKTGALEMQCRVQCAHEGSLTADARGILTGLIQHTDLQIKLLAPAVAQEVDEEDEEAAEEQVTPESALQRSIEEEASGGKRQTKKEALAAQLGVAPE